jgi:putative membrane protein
MEVAPFEEFMGSHGGLGGQQTKPFAVIPDDWSEAPGPIVGVERMHEALAEWLAESRAAAHHATAGAGA